MAKHNKRLRRSVRVEVFREYCANSSIHGVRYFNRDERTACERFWWLVVFLLSLLGCGVMIHKTYEKWNQAPIIVTFSEKPTPVWDIHFPAVTICPETKVAASSLNFTAEINVLANDTHYGNEASERKSRYGSKRRVLLYGIKLLSVSSAVVLNELKPQRSCRLALPWRTTVALCYYGTDFTECENQLKVTLTEEGICYTFNMLPDREIFRKNAMHTDYIYTRNWYIFPGFQPPAPSYARDAGLHAGLTLYLAQKNEDTDYLCTGYSQGYKLKIHSIDEYPHMAKRNLRLPLGHEISIALKPQMIVTSPSAADYSWEKRQCFFNHERHLRYFQIYNQENCELECLTNVTRAMCGCVRFSMPRSNDTKVCTLSMWHCMYRSKWFLRPIPGLKRQPHRVILEMVKNCNCLPACSSVSYDVEMAQTSLDMEKFRLANNELPRDHLDKFTITTLAIYFKESYFISSKRSELYGWVDFLANCGGLLGLFMGVSILSLLEICYFITIRPFSVRSRIASAEKRKSNEVQNAMLPVICKPE
uniref:pickpocket protein 28-like n=1 Tax=Anopheles coluzzii TaxID=1518534 RepID=UPI0020FF7F85|nr:pickpocket protein 28-like [Anopheles coluzzii]